MSKLLALALLACLASQSLAKKHFMSDDEEERHSAFKKG